MIVLIFIELAKNSKGRNRLREHGQEWRVIRNDTLDDKPALLTESVKDGYLRWWKLEEIVFKEIKNATT